MTMPQPVNDLEWGGLGNGTGKPIHGQTAQEIWQQVQRFAVGENQTFADMDIMTGTKIIKIVNGAHVNIRGVIPLVRQVPGNRHVADNDSQSMLPVTEIREGDDDFLAHAQHLLHDVFGVIHGLQGLRQDHHIERLRLEA